MKKVLSLSIGFCLFFSGFCFGGIGGCPLSDISGDCKVTLADFAIMAAEWLFEGDADTPDIIWVWVGDPGVPGHEAFTGQMSRYETTNAQFAHYLNDAISSGDVIVSGDYVVGAGGSHSGTDYVGEGYYDLAGSGYTGYGATNGGAARINWTGSAFTVDGGFEDHPVTYVSWYGAMAFASYYGWRLPTEWEWQATADYNGSYTYGCGTTINTSIANYMNSVHPDGTTPVGAFGLYGYGLADMAGNVWDWTSSCYFGDCDPDYRVFRGGSWNLVAFTCAFVNRSYESPNIMSYYCGFRVCR